MSFKRGSLDKLDDGEWSAVVESCFGEFSDPGVATVSVGEAGTDVVEEFTDELPVLQGAVGESAVVKGVVFSEVDEAFEAWLEFLSLRQSGSDSFGSRVLGVTGFENSSQESSEKCVSGAGFS